MGSFERLPTLGSASKMDEEEAEMKLAIENRRKLKMVMTDVKKDKTFFMSLFIVNKKDKVKTFD